ncbi:MAG: PA14 domain-containing protein [Phycisphaerales bacterium JB059]
MPRLALLVTITLSLGASLALARPERPNAPTASNADLLRFDSLRNTPTGERVRIDGFRLTGGETVGLDLQRIELLTPDARLVLGTPLGETDLPRPDVVLLSGRVIGDDRSTVYLALSAYGTHGFVDSAGALHSVSTGAFAHAQNLPDPLRVADVRRLAFDAPPPPAGCAFEAPDATRSAPAPHSRGAPPCRLARVAIETDWPYTDRLFAGNTDASAAYAVSLLGAVSEIYQRDLGVRLGLSFLRVWAADIDPYANGGNLLLQLTDHWDQNLNDVDRATVHFLSGVAGSGFGGNAWFGLRCANGNGYSVSQSLAGFFPYPLQDHSAANRDLYVVAHTLGHNFGAQHTHNTAMYDPPLDGCGLGDCADAFGGTIMSYCYECPGGLANIALTFHPQVRLDMLAYLDSIADPDCLLDLSGAVAIDDTAYTGVDHPVEINILANDDLASCHPVSVLSHDTVSAQGGLVALLPNASAFGRDQLRYTPPAGFVGEDSFAYTLDSGPSAMVFVDVETLREPETPASPQPGLAVSYFDLDNLSALPDFATLTPYASDVVPGVNFQTSNAEFATSERTGYVGALFTGYVLAPSDGVYTFTTSSDEGSTLWIGDRLVVDNDGLHTLQTRSGQIALAAGPHALRIEYFEQSGLHSLIATIAGPSLSQTVLTELLLTHDPAPPCSPADLAPPFGELDFSDVTRFLASFVADDPEADLAPPLGVLDFTDILIFLSAFGAGCG